MVSEVPAQGALLGHRRAAENPARGESYRGGLPHREVEVMPNHVHIFIKAKPSIAIDELVQGLKGYTSYVLRQEYRWLEKMKHLWSPSYYVESIGHISEETVRRYIEEQKKTAQRKAGPLSSHD